MIDDLIIGAICLAVALVAIAMGVTIYQDSKAETFSLKKGAWVCTDERQRPTTYIKSGNVLIPVTGSDCYQWQRVAK